MHSYIFIIGLSVLAQLTAAVLALRLIRVTGQRTSWILIAAALIGMAVRRIIVFSRWYFGIASPTPDVPYELIGLAVSLMMAVGIAWVGPLIRSIKDSQRAVRESEIKYRGVFESVGDAIFLVDRETGAILDANSGACAMYGHSRAEMLALRPVDLSTDPEATVDAVKKAVRHVPLRYHRKKDGTVFPVEITGSSIEMERRPIFLVSIRDISERLRLQEKELSVERIMAVGRMAGGIAHRLNNMMVAVTGYSSLLLQRLAPGDPREREIRQILEAGHRAAILTRQLLAIGRRQMLQPKEIELNAFIREAAPALRVVAGDGVALSIATGQDPVRVVIDPEQLEWTLEALVKNARDAGSGQVTIGVGRAELAAGQVAGDEFTVAPGAYAVLTVGDTGCGMDPQSRSRLFTPFFTTKEGGEGLALASSYGFIKQSGGYILVDSAVGTGTTFTIYFPRVDGPVRAPQR